MELKSFNLNLLRYRDLAIFQENVVNRVPDDVVSAAKPIRARVEGRFKARGRITTTVGASQSW